MHDTNWSNHALVFGTGDGPGHLPFVAPFLGVIDGSEDSAFHGSRSFLRDLVALVARALEPGPGA